MGGIGQDSMQISNCYVGFQIASCPFQGDSPNRLVENRRSERVAEKLGISRATDWWKGSSGLWLLCYSA